MAEKSDQSLLSQKQQKVLAGFFIAVAILQLSYYFVYRPLSMHGVDFTVLWRAAHQVCIGASPYDPPEVLIGKDGWEVFKYPQFLALVMSWLGLFPLYSAEVIWKIILLVASFAALDLSLRHLRKQLSSLSPPLCPSPQSRFLALAGMVLAYSLFSPLSWSLELGQVGSLLLLLMLAAAMSISARRDVSVGLFFSLATLIKLTPVFLLFQGGLHRRWKSVLAAALTIVLYAALLGGAGFWREEIRYFTEVLPSIPQLTRLVSHSFLDLLAHLVMWGGGDAISHDAPVQTVLHAGASVVYLAVLFSLAWRGLSWEECYPVGLIGVLVISPVVEGHHYVILWPAWLAQYGLVLQRRLPLWLGVMILGAWLPIFLATTFAHRVGGAAWQYVPAVSCAILWVLSILVAAMASRRA